MNTHEENINENDAPAEQVAATDRPLGYWLRLVDALITREFDERLAGSGADRRDWMLLNILAGSQPRARGPRGKRMRRLEERGWIEQNGSGEWSLTEAGREMKDSIAEAVSGIRERVSSAVTPEEYATTLASLKAMARELGGEDLDAGDPRGAFGRGRRGRPFGRGFGPGPFGRGFGPGFGPGTDDEPRRHPHHGHGGHGHGHTCAHARGHDGRGRGDQRHGERAYERGFDAGFARGRASTDG